MRILFCTLACFVFAGKCPVAAQEQCTVAVVSGAATIDGRPLLWKNRDSSFRDNKVAFFNGPGYDFIGVINADDTTQVWMGLNTAGFAIMNSESMDQPGDSIDTEGFFMKKALGCCGRLEDLMTLLNETNISGRGTRSNFGCIDAFGGAAFFETGNYSYTRMDAGDTLLSADGFLVRANFSMTGSGDEGYGGWRFHRARHLLGEAVRAEKLDQSYILRHVARDLVTDQVDPYPWLAAAMDPDDDRDWLETHNSINRHRTVSCAVFHGVKPGEDPSLATMWCVLGEPICSVAVPLWPRSGEIPPALNGKKKAALNKKFIERKRQLYPDQNRPKELRLSRLHQGTPFFEQRRDALEEEIIAITDEKLQTWRRNMPNYKHLADLQAHWVNRVMQEF